MNKCGLLLLLSFGLGSGLFAQAGKPSPEAALVGDWRGDSICVVHPSACHDEKALYRVKAGTGSPRGYTLDAYKIVDGKPDFMGDMECSYATEKRELTCSTPKLAVHLVLDGKSLNGTMNLSDGTLWRNITLQRD